MCVDECPDRELDAAIAASLMTPSSSDNAPSTVFARCMERHVQGGDSVESVALERALQATLADADFEAWRTGNAITVVNKIPQPDRLNRQGSAINLNFRLGASGVTSISSFFKKGTSSNETSKHPPPNDSNLGEQILTLG